MQTSRSFVSHAVYDGVALLRVTGELDLARADHVRRRGEQLLTDGVRCLRIDLSRVTFIDSIGLAALTAIRNTASAAGCRLTLQRPSEPVLRVLHFTGMNDSFA